MSHHLQVSNCGKPKMPLIFGRSGTQYVPMVTKLLSTYCRAHLVESHCKELNTSGTNWLRYHSSSFSIDGRVYDVITYGTKRDI